MNSPVSPVARRASSLRIVGIGLASAACAGAQWYIRTGAYRSQATCVLVAAALLTAILLGRPEPLDTALPAVSPVLPPRRRWRNVAGTALAILGCGTFLYAACLLTIQWQQDFTRAAPLAIGGLSMWSAGLWVWDVNHGSRSGRLPMVRWERWLLLAIIGLGFFLRFYRYDYFPPPDGVCAVEEPQAGMFAHEILHDGERPWEFVGDRWLPVPFFALFGESLTTLRVPFTIVSGLTIIALYFLLRQLVARGVALSCTALFAMCSWHLIYARLAHNVFATTLIVVLILSRCLRVHRRGGLAAYPWIGFLTAYTLYTYAGYRGTTLFVVVFFLISLAMHVRDWQTAIILRRRIQARRVLWTQITGLVFAVIAYAALLPPLAAQLRSNPAQYFEAANRSLLNRTYYTSNMHAFVQQRIRRLRETASIFNHYGDPSLSFNLPGAPMLEPVTGVLFVIGLMYCLVWGRHRFQGFFVFMFLLLLLMGTTFVQNLDVRRLQGIIPLIFVLIAFSVDRFRQLVQARAERWARPLLVTAALAIAGLALRNNFDLYFGRMMSDPHVRAGFQNHYTMTIRYLHTLPRNAYMLLIGYTYNLFMPNDYAWWRGDDVPGGASADLAPLFNGQEGPWVGRDLRVVIESPLEREALAHLLQERFPGTRCETITHPDNLPYLDLTSCRVTPVADPVGSKGGVRGRYFRGDAPEPFLERTDPVISFGFTPPDCTFPVTVDHPLCRVEWEGSWDVPRSGVYQLQADVRTGDVSVSVDGRPVVGPLELNEGPHVVGVRAHYHWLEEAGTRLWWRGSDPTWQLVAFVKFDAQMSAPQE